MFFSAEKRPANADALQVVAHVSARREHLLALLVRQTDVPFDELLDGTAEPATRELWKVGVIESDERHAAPPCDARRRPRRVEGIADLDEIGFERVDRARPAQRIQRQPVVERARHFAARDGGDIARGTRRVLARHDETVPPVRVRAHPLVLREQIAPHPTAGGRIEKSGVDDVHRIVVLERASIRAQNRIDQSAQARFRMGTNTYKQTRAVAFAVAERGRGRF